MDTHITIEPGMKVAVLGLGVTGRAAIRYFLHVGAQVLVSDAREYDHLQQEEQQLLGSAGVQFECGGHSASFLQAAELVVISPGISPEIPLLQELRKKGVAVVGELAIAASVLSVPVIGITGTNGKTTVTSLVGDLLAGCGKKVFVGGNIGTPLFDYLCTPDAADVVVLELSSFQLEVAGDFRPDVGLLLNVTPDHLDRHGNMARYGAAKMQLFAHQRQNDLAIVNGDDEVSVELFCRTTGRQPVLFGTGPDCAAQIAGDTIVVRGRERNERFSLVSSQLNSYTGRLNSAAALLVTSRMGCDAVRVQKALDGFEMPRHRMEYIAEIHGVLFINDSKATNTGATLSALAQIDGPVVLIAGGTDKGDDYSLLGPAVKHKVRTLVLIGEAADKIAQRLDGMVEMKFAESMDEAVMVAAASARAGDTVLLAPACASFDMFRGYGHRGDVFAAAVHQREQQTTRQELYAE